MCNLTNLPKIFQSNSNFLVIKLSIYICRQSLYLNCKVAGRRTSNHHFTFHWLLLDPDIAKEAGVFLRFLIPGLFAYSFLQNILRFLQAQSIIMPLALCSVGFLVIHIGIAYALVNWTDLAFKGAALAASISIWISLLTLGIYVLFSKRFSHIRPNCFSFEPFRHILTNLKLALPSAAMVCLEYWAFELLVLLAGLMPNSGTNTSVVAMCVNTQNIAYMISYGLSAAASTRVANELGAGNTDRAKNAMV
ncbi:PREDICTED: protein DETOXIFICATION 19-like isoform X1 [Nicotiana attenuata]|uniref:protein DETOXIFICATION 19-like isoform X1 n=1 Tax=Nicotiana attenuata TaxID=49451 RepID=UPI000904AD5E|nr:PREDICTED: protein DETOXIFICATION 19-like isoform X1 [Nicotiana attenuata]XP_019249465.1 PREDICTED: protein DETOXIFICATION 19-like isoform X1 [Nicotiana attenuata]